MNSNAEAPRCLDGCVDPHAAVADDDLVADAAPGASGSCGRRRAVDDEPAVHLRVLDGHPLAVDAARRWRGWWWSRSRPGARRRGRPPRAWWSPDVTRLAPCTCSDVDEAVELGLVALELDARAARVGVGAPDLDVGQVVGDAGLDDGVEDLGEEQRVDDVARQLDGLGGHAPWVACRHLWVSRSPSSRSSPPPTRPSCGSRRTARCRAWATSATSGRPSELLQRPVDELARRLFAAGGVENDPHQRLRRHRHPRRRAHRARAWATSSASCSSTTATPHRHACRSDEADADSTRPGRPSSPGCAPDRARGG